ncbi:unnamed protein product [Brassica oleracea]
MHIYSGEHRFILTDNGPKISAVGIEEKQNNVDDPPSLIDQDISLIKSDNARKRVGSNAVVIFTDEMMLTALDTSAIFVLDPNEYITAVEINYDNIFCTESEIITMLRFTTNKRTSPPFGLEGAKSILLKENGHKVVGFHGKAGADILHQVGVHVKPISK